MLRVAYDVSVLGLGHYQSRARTGVFRVVDAVVRGLARSPDVALSLCATNSPTADAAAPAYLAGDPALSQLPFVAGPGNRTVRAARAALLRAGLALDGDLTIRSPLGQWAKTSPQLAPPRRVLRSALFRTTAALQRLAPALDAASFTGVELFHSPYHPVPEALAAAPHLGKLLTVYDLIPILFPQYFDDAAVAHMLRQGVTSLGGAGIALCISEATKRDLCEHLKLPPERAVVTHLAASALFAPVSDAARRQAVRARYGIPEGPYLLSLCTLEPRKNIEHSIRCFLRFIEQERIPDLNLVLVGTKGWNYDRIFDAIAAGSRYRDRVVVTGFVADADLAAIYSAAQAFVYPSHYEGFGLPVLEAMQCGIPVITSNTSSLPEVVGDAGIMLAPTDADGLCAAMQRLYRDDGYRATLAAKALARAGLFSWDRCVAETVAAYRRCADAR